MSPLLGEEYVAIFKNGDDLRQDQLILQVPGTAQQLLTYLLPGD
jgi:phosphatidylinositol kinase/protein kinase (PI-3  family)